MPAPDYESMPGEELAKLCADFNDEAARPDYESMPGEELAKLCADFNDEAAGEELVNRKAANEFVGELKEIERQLQDLAKREQGNEEAVEKIRLVKSVSAKLNEQQQRYHDGDHLARLKLWWWHYVDIRATAEEFVLSLKGKYPFLAEKARDELIYLAEKAVEELEEHVKRPDIMAKYQPERSWFGYWKRKLGWLVQDQMRHQNSIEKRKKHYSPRSPAMGTLQDAVTREEECNVKLALESLDAASRELLILRFYKDLTLKEIALKLDQTYGQVYRRLINAFTEFRKHYCHLDRTRKENEP